MQFTIAFISNMLIDIVHEVLMIHWSDWLLKKKKKIGNWNKLVGLIIWINH